MMNDLSTISADLLKGLNPEQREACTLLDGALLVLAGAGTGKTRVLTTRLANLITSGKARPYEILAVTFTNKAAAEMRQRIEKLLGADDETASQINVGTFHSLSARFLRQHSEFMGLTPRFTILDPDDQTRLMREILTESGASGDDNNKAYARMLVYMIDRWKNKAWLPENVPNEEKIDMKGTNLQNFYQSYQTRLQELNAVDFGDLLLHMVNLWQKYPDILQKFQQRFKYILVDEYQDTNVAQYLWLRLLAQKNRNICCVGDDDQAIYSWRGAEISNILRFEKDYPEAKTIRLETNYRSTGHILNVASQLIDHNKGRMGKNLRSNDEAGERIRLCRFFSGDEEARYVAGEIESLACKKIPFDEMAILVRTGAQTRAFEESLLRAGISYQIIGGLRFYEREEVRDMIGYLRLVAQDNDDLALQRIINTPTRGLGGASLQLLRQQAAKRKMPIYTLMKTALDDIPEIKPRIRNICHHFVAMIEHARQMSETDSLPQITEFLIEESGYRAMLKKSADTIKSAGKQENLDELLVAQQPMHDLDEFLEHISLIMDAATRTEKSVYLMTIHAAKGLEFDTVFLPGWEEGLFPSQRTIDESGNDGLEEERRLAYVALTRAKRRAFVSHVAGRRLYGQFQMAMPSRFIAELAEESLEVLA
ncbi:MAG: UvrD-helicase domain-containing protein [Alphaproteobacteria bacterium]|nr:UvrD-helicase domain-containing protein [Alphaproteobacteria bacterium]